MEGAHGSEEEIKRLGLLASEVSPPRPQHAWGEGSLGDPAGLQAPSFARQTTGAANLLHSGLAPRLDRAVARTRYHRENKRRGFVVSFFLQNNGHPLTRLGGDFTGPAGPAATSPAATGGE